MCSTQDDAALPAPGFPIRRSTGQRLFSASPWLIAAVHVLHQLLVPRHPPCALHILTVIAPEPALRQAQKSRCSCFIWPTVQFSRSGKRLAAAKATAWSLKTKQHADRPAARGGAVVKIQVGRRFRKDLRQAEDPDPDRSSPLAEDRRSLMGSLERR
jgi:hypothetical protein